MPFALAARPRNRLPPPMTTATCTPSPWMSAMSRAICAVTAGSMPNCCSPMRASPDSFSRTRLYRADISERLYLRQARRSALLRALLADLEPHEPRDGDVLAQDADRVLHQLRDGDVGVAHRRLLQQAELLVERVHLSLDDLVDDLRRLVLHLVLVDVPLAG